MTGRIVKDYFVAFRWSNFKTKVAHFLYLIVYFSTMLPGIAGFFEKGEYALVYFLLMIPTIHILNSGALHIMKMPKMMYMVPLSEEMKREYIVKSALFRISFCSLLGVVCTLPLVLLGICRIITYVVLVYDFVTLALIFCGMNERYSIEEREAWPEVKSDCRGIIMAVDIMLTIISIFVIACMLCWDGGMVSVYANIVLIIPALLFQLPLTIKFMSGWNKAVERALSYEISYDK